MDRNKPLIVTVVLRSQYGKLGDLPRTWIQNVYHLDGGIMAGKSCCTHQASPMRKQTLN